jgi:hypothetical protein
MSAEAVRHIVRRLGRGGSLNLGQVRRRRSTRYQSGKKLMHDEGRNDRLVPLPPKPDPWSAGRAHPFILGRIGPVARRSRRRPFPHRSTGARCRTRPALRTAADAQPWGASAAQFRLRPHDAAAGRHARGKPAGPRSRWDRFALECVGGIVGFLEHPPCPTLGVPRRGHGTSNASMGEALKRPASRNEPSRLRRVRLPGTVPLPPPAVSRRPQGEEDEQEASGTGTARQVVE